ncbi:hypothetical protein BGZ68_006013 [Mortierella alpina]|nr:hypothetical protein BGZ68_006013 [Mortierella alpina]
MSHPASSPSPSWSDSPSPSDPLVHSDPPPTANLQPARSPCVPFGATNSLLDTTCPVSSTTTTRTKRAATSSARGSSSLPLFFILLCLNCLFSSLSSTKPLSSSSSPSLRTVKTTASFLLLQGCDAARNLNSNQRVDAPSPDDFAPLTGPQFEYTKRTPLGDLQDPREYADGALATQKLIAAPLIPLDRQMWVGVDTRTAYFGDQFGKDKIENVPQLLQAGVRRLVVDLWWDGADLGWQLCPRIKRDGAQVKALRLALEQEQKELALSLQHLAVSQQQREATLKGTGAGAGAGAGAGSETVLTLTTTPPAPQPVSTLESKAHPSHHGEKNTHRHQTGHTSEGTASHGHEKEGANTKVRRHLPGAKDVITRRSLNKHTGKESSETRGSRKNSGKEMPNGHANRKKASAEDGQKKQGSIKDKARAWFRKKGSHQRHSIKAGGPRHKHVYKSAAVPGPAIRGAALDPSRERREREKKLHHLKMSKSIVSTYDSTAAVDQTVDGITCSSGEDLVMLLQQLQGWVLQTTKRDLEDVLLIILNLNELESRPPTKTPSLFVNNTNSWANVTENPSMVESALSTNDDHFLQSLVSPNTNVSIKAALPSMISLKDLFLDAFPEMIYDPTILKKERADLNATWWQDGPVGLDYYNTTIDPATGKVQAPTGWPTSEYLTADDINRRVIIGIGANNLRSNTTYNISDDLSVLYTSDALGLSMNKSNQIQISSALNGDRCEFPAPGVMMVPTGSEDSLERIVALKADNATVSRHIPWSFSSMTDTDLIPWSYDSGRLATDCGYSILVESRASALTFSEQTAMSIWSWDLDQPPANEMRSRDRRCGAMERNGRWVVQNCNMKLPVACRKIGTSGKWIIHEKGAGNYRDVSCPEGYAFDVPRTARENQALYSVLQAYLNVTEPVALSALMAKRERKREALRQSLDDPFHALLNSEAGVSVSHSRRHDSRHARDEDDDDDDEDEDDDSEVDDWDSDHGESEDRKDRSSRGISSATNGRSSHAEGSTNKRYGPGMLAAKDMSGPMASLPTARDQLREGVIWIDISSWQTAGCWVPGGVHGICPYQDPDNTVALQEIIKVSTIGGVIILVLVGMFLYLKCRRNVRLRKSSKRRADVRTKLMRTEVETVPA